jgi:hypothetical protein
VRRARTFSLQKLSVSPTSDDEEASPRMWQQYRKNLLANQTVILLVCVILALLAGADVLVIAAVFGAMQVGALGGAAISARAERRAVAEEELG